MIKIQRTQKIFVHGYLNQEASPGDILVMYDRINRNGVNHEYSIHLKMGLGWCCVDKFYGNNAIYEIKYCWGIDIENGKFMGPEEIIKFRQDEYNRIPGTDDSRLKYHLLNPDPLVKKYRQYTFTEKG